MASIKYQDFALTATGDVIPGATVLVEEYPSGTRASLSDASGAPIVNPVVCDSSGYYSFYADNGHYSLVISGYGLTPRRIDDISLSDPDASGSGAPGPPGPPGAPGTSGTGYVFAGSNPFAPAVPLAPDNGTAAFNALLTALAASTSTGSINSATGGWTIVLDRGNYLFDPDAITINMKNICLQGWGSSDGASLGVAPTTTIVFTGDGSVGMRWGDPTMSSFKEGCQIRGIRFDGNGHTFTKAIVYLSLQQHLYMERVSIANGPFSAPGQGRALICQSVWDSWFDKIIVSNHRLDAFAAANPLLGPGTGVAAWYWTNSRDLLDGSVPFNIPPNTFGSNCNNIRINGVHCENIRGTHFSISDSCNALAFFMQGGNKFERGNEGASTSGPTRYCMYIGNIFESNFSGCHFTNFNTAGPNFAAVVAIGMGGLGTSGINFTGNQFVQCTANILAGPLTQASIIKDNLGGQATTQVVSTTTNAGNWFEHPLSQANLVQATGWHQRLPVGYMPISQFVQANIPEMNIMGFGQAGWVDGLARRRTATAEGNIIAQGDVALMPKLRDSPGLNYNIALQIRRTADDVTPGGGTHGDASLEIAATPWYAGGAPQQMPRLAPLPGSVGISNIVGDGVTVTVDTIQSHGFYAGQSVIIAGTVGFDATVVIAGITDTNTFTYAGAALGPETIGGIRPVNLANVSGDGTTVTVDCGSADINNVGDLVSSGSGSGTCYVRLKNNANRQNVRLVEGALLTIAGTTNFNGTYNITSISVDGGLDYATFSLVTHNPDETAGTVGCHGLMPQDTVVITGTNNYNTTAGSPVAASLVLGNAGRFTYLSAQTGGPDTGIGNWQLCQIQSVQWTITPTLSQNLGRHVLNTTLGVTDHFRWQYGALNQQKIDVIGVAVTPTIASQRPFMLSVTSNTSAALSDISVSLMRVRLGLTTDISDTIQSSASLLADLALQVYDGMTYEWRYANMTGWTVTLGEAPLDGGMTLKSITGATISTDTIEPFTTAVYLVSFARVQPISLSGAAVIAVSIQRIASYRTIDRNRYVGNTFSTDANHTITGAEAIGTHYYRTGTTQNRQDTGPQAVNLIAAIPVEQRLTGSSWLWNYVNSTAFYMTVTLSNTGVLDPGGGAVPAAIVAPGMTYQFRWVLTNVTSGAEAATVVFVNATANAVITQNTGLTATPGGGQAGALTLLGRSNTVATCATFGDSVKLPLSIWVGGTTVRVFNAGAFPMDLFPALGGTINNLAANTAISIAPGSGVHLEAYASNVWRTF
jgi:hypothetical protein